jgi:hypothetical protein
LYKEIKHEEIALFAIIALTAGCIDATAQNKKDMKKSIICSY